jgi:anti-anti-sigma factor
VAGRAAIINRLIAIDTTHGTDARIVLVGALTARDVEALRDTIESLLDDGYRAFELNMESVPSTDSGGLRAIVESYVTVTRRGGKMRIVGAPVSPQFQLPNLTTLSWSERMPKISECVPTRNSVDGF